MWEHILIAPKSNEAVQESHNHVERVKIHRGVILYQLPPNSRSSHKLNTSLISHLVAEKGPSRDGKTTKIPILPDAFMYLGSFHMFHD